MIGSIRLWCLALFLLLAPSFAWAQGKVLYNASTDGAGGTATLPLSEKYNSVLVEVTIADTAEVEFFISGEGAATTAVACINYSSTSFTAATSATATGTYLCPTSGASGFTITLGAHTGAVRVYASPSAGTAKRGGGGGGAGTVTSVDASGGVETASGSAITGTGTIRGNASVNAQIGTTYTILSTDRGKLITFSNADPIAVTLPEAGTAGFDDGFYFQAVNLGAGTVTITPTTSTIQGGVDLDLMTGKGVTIASDGTDYWHNPGLGLTAEAQSLGDVITINRTFGGAVSAATGPQFGSSATGRYWVPFDDPTEGLMFDCVVATVLGDCDKGVKIYTDHVWSFKDNSGNSVLTINPYAASVNAMYPFGSGYRPLKSIWLDAGAASTDGAQCAAPTESPNTVVKTWTIVCEDHDSGAMYWKVGMPDAWDGGPVTFELQIHQVGASTNTIEIDFAAMCYSHDEAAAAFASPPTGEQAASITLTADNDILHGTTSAVTVAGTTCAGGDTLFVTGQVDATASHADIATAVEILGVKMEYAVSSLSD